MNKRILSLTLLTALTLEGMAQVNMKIQKNDGSMLTMPVDSIESIHFVQQAPASLDGLTGRWLLIAANNGIEVAPGIYSAATDTIPFTAQVADDGLSLQCHTDCLYSRSGNIYPADWRMTVEQNDNGQRRIGWVLDSQQPASTKEFHETADKYLEKGFWYWGNQYSGEQDNGHRYLYLLAENSDATAIIGMTFWSQWQSSDATRYDLSNTDNNSHKVYLVVAMDIPYARSLGYVEIWGSPRFEKLAD